MGAAKMFDSEINWLLVPCLNRTYKIKVIILEHSLLLVLDLKEYMYIFI